MDSPFDLRHRSLRLASAAFLAVALVAGWLRPALAELPLPPVVLHESHGPAVLQWTALPDIRFDSARLVRDDGVTSNWEVVQRRGNFTVVKSTNSNNFTQYTGYVGPQRFNAAWFGQSGIGQRRVVAIEDLGASQQSVNAPVQDGVDPRSLATRFRLVVEDNQGRYTEVVSRQVLRALIVPVVINGQEFFLRAYEIEVRAERPEDGWLRAGVANYVPALGIATAGRFETPTQLNWRFESIQVAPQLIPAISAAAAAASGQ